MKQPLLGLNLEIKKTRKREFLTQMDKVVRWDDLLAPFVKVLQCLISCAFFFYASSIMEIQ